MSVYYYNCRQRLQTTISIICHAGQYVHAVQHGNVSSGAMFTQCHETSGFHTGTHFAYLGGMTRLSWPRWLVKNHCATRDQRLNEVAKGLSLFVIHTIQVI